MSESGKRCGSGSHKLRTVSELDELRWSAVTTRDATASGVFVYAVKSTGVFCRPGCASRRPLRRNVEFFATPVEAVAAGFRACRRCRPDEGIVRDHAADSVIELCRRIEHATRTIDVVAFAAEHGYSERHLRRKFVEIMGVSVTTYARITRIERVRDSLQAKAPVTQAIVDAGYGSSRAFYDNGASQLGMAPRQYRDGGVGERIVFTSLATPIGAVVAAATARGVCAVRIGSDEATIIRELNVEFSNASLVRDDDALVDVARILAGAVRGEAGAASLPMDLEGTAFQMRVWDVLRRIPVGETRTYSEVAAHIGSPRAVRAVGSACAANPAAIAVPCHRVIRHDGTLGGYRWGLETKETLLNAEHVARGRENP